ncbi:MAG: hypothetical protein QUU85_05975, partial [Candidatus Eisenbacteria bacterium]|nr:hypothetical protein [Candidatus Eisenbacteria bacterium]
IRDTQRCLVGSEMCIRDSARPAAVRPRNDRAPGGVPIAERVLFIPRMSGSAATCVAAAIRGAGVDARPIPPSDSRTIELGGRHTSGEECFPERATLGDILRIVQDGPIPKERLAFFMPTAPGPCRFGQYAPFLRRVLDSVGAESVAIVSPTSGSGYDLMGMDSRAVQRASWRALVAADLLRKATLRVRPYEIEAGTTDRLYDRSIDAVCAILETRGATAGETLAKLRSAMDEAAAAFESVPRRSEDRLRIGVVGEIFCRMNTFSNEEMVRKIEAQGGEAWISDISEWIYYTNLEQRRKWIRYAGQTFSLRMLGAYVKEAFQRSDEHALAAPFHALFEGREEPERMKIVTDLAEPYLPASGVYGEMVISAGKAVYFWSKGCDGIVDISPFSCMNGIVSEAVYPKISRDHDGIPIRIFYFDGTQSHLERDLGIFFELARTYRKRKERAAAGRA